MGWFRRRRERERDLSEELAAHLAIEQAEQQRAGRTADEARNAARAAFGNVTKVQEDARAAWGFTAVESLAQDCLFGSRLLRRTPGWTVVVCLTLALGIGIGTAIFSVVHAVLLAPLPYASPERLVALYVTARRSPAERIYPSPALWREWRRRLGAFDQVALVKMVGNFNLTGGGPPERLLAARTSFNVPAALGVRPLLGRTFTEAEQEADARVAILSHGLWLRRFGGDPGIVGRKIQLSGEAVEVIGVMPKTYHFPDATFEIWAPLHLPPADVVHGADYGYLVVSRLRPGLALAAAQRDAERVMEQLAVEHPGPYRPLEVHVEPLAQTYAALVRPALLVLSAAVASLLALGCLNLAVLLFARAGARAHELRTRLALGASGGRLRRQLLAESLPLALAGGLAGAGCAYGLMRFLLALLPANFPRLEEATLNGPVLGFAITAALAIVLLASLLPSFSRTALAMSARGTTADSRPRQWLVAAQVAIATVLVFGGLLSARSFGELLNVRPGFDAHGVLTLHLAVSRRQFPKDAEIARYYDRLTERIRALPGVVEAGFANRLPLSNTAQTGGVEFEGREGRWSVDWRSITPGYLGAMGIPIVQGRGFTRDDRPDSPAVGLIDDVLAKRVFGGASPVGRRFRHAAPPGQMNTEPWGVIVGVAGHVLNDSLEKDPRPQVYWPETQEAQDRAALAVRVRGNPAAFAEAVTAAIRQENPDQPVYDVRTMNDWVARSLQLRTLATSLVALFALASLVLASLGLYGVLSYGASLRQREFGIRVALGATRSAVGRLIVAEGGRLVVSGVALGLLLCWPASAAARAFLFGVERFDLWCWLLAPLALITVGLLASAAPARRAANADPARMLRVD